MEENRIRIEQERMLELERIKFIKNQAKESKVANADYVNDFARYQLGYCVPYK